MKLTIDTDEMSDYGSVFELNVLRETVRLLRSEARLVQKHSESERPDYTAEEQAFAERCRKVAGELAAIAKEHWSVPE